MNFKRCELWDLITDMYPVLAFHTFKYIHEISWNKDPFVDFMKKGTKYDI
jgi:hypothetical protein